MSLEGGRHPVLMFRRIIRDPAFTNICPQLIAKSIWRMWYLMKNSNYVRLKIRIMFPTRKKINCCYGKMAFSIAGVRS